MTPATTSTRARPPDIELYGLHGATRIGDDAGFLAVEQVGADDRGAF